MPAPPSTVRWDVGARRFRDIATGYFVGFREAAERVRVVQITPTDYRLQDATGRFVGDPQFSVTPDYSWTSPNKRYVRFTRETDPHRVGEPIPWTSSLVNRYDYYSEGELIGTKFSSLGYGIEYSLQDVESEQLLLEGYKQTVAVDLGIDVERIDEVSLGYLEYRYYTPLT